MKKKLLPLIAALLLSAALLAAGCGKSPSYDGYTPPKTDGNGGFDYPSNSFSADVKLDGFLNDERWRKPDVISLGSWDGEETEGAVVGNTADYANTKRMIIKMFRGEVCFHFGFEVKDDNPEYLKLEDGDPAIWSDNVLVNLCTALDGAEIPMSDDYYLMVTAFGNYCFRRGANAAGMWGAWSGVLDYQAAIHYEDDGETIKGFGVELVVPYSQLGLTKDSPIGVTFRSCDKVGGDLLEREWWYKGGTHHFNLPNTYVVWDGDNNLYDFYEYEMPDVSVNGAVTDYVSGANVAGATVSADGKIATTDTNGAFSFTEVEANKDLVINVTGDALIMEQSFTISRDELRALKGGMYNYAARVLTKANPITATVKGSVTTLNDAGQTVAAAGATVKVGSETVAVKADGTYEIECTFNAYTLPVSVYMQEGVAINDEISVQAALAGDIIIDKELPRMSKLPLKFGAKGDLETCLGWTGEGLYVSIRGERGAGEYGRGVAFSTDGESGKVVLYHAIGTMAYTDFVIQDWGGTYAPPATHGVTASQKTFNGVTEYTFVIPYEKLGIEYGDTLKIAPFEYTGPFNYYTDGYGVTHAFGNLASLATYPMLDKTGAVTFTEPAREEVLSAFSLEAFGNSNAEVKFQKIGGAKEGIRVTI